LLLAVPAHPEKVGPITVSMLENARIEKKALLAVDQAFAVTPADAQLVSNFNAPYPHLLQTCVSDHAITRHLPKNESEIYGLADPNAVCFVGYYDHYPNLDGVLWYLQKIHPQVLRKLPHYKFYVVGDGNTGPIKAYAGNDPSVVITGRVENIAEPILRSKVCVSPLISGAGIRGKLNQYSTLHRPTVSTQIGVSGMPYVDQESVLVADDPTQFANSVVQLLTDEPLWRKIQVASTKIANENYTWPKVVGRLENFYLGRTT
jgi:glycosyltransferase involved in cell wall biosynthesis